MGMGPTPILDLGFVWVIALIALWLLFVIALIVAVNLFMRRPR